MGPPGMFERGDPGLGARRADGRGGRGRAGIGGARCAAEGLARLGSPRRKRQIDRHMSTVMITALDTHHSQIAWIENSSR